jgi:iron complex transport system ATP-binding protein
VTPVLATRDVRVGFRAGHRVKRVVIENLSLSVGAGEFICLLGPNGAGKSSLLRTLAGVQPPLDGTVDLAGSDLNQMPRAEVARQLATVLTDQHDTGRLTGRDLVSLGRHPYTGWFGRLDEHDDEVVNRALATVSVAHLAERTVAELSDGERQRLMIARALAQQPAIILLDEPAAFLDVTARVELVALLQRLAREHQLAIVLATHDLELALRSADRMWLLGSDGRLAAGLPEDVVAHGLLDRAFPNANWAFDPIQWRFVFCGEPTGVATVTGTSLHASLARRILEREGFLVDPIGAPRDVQLAIEVVEGSRAVPTMIAHYDGGTETHEALQPLADLARRVASTRRASRRDPA